MHESEKHSTPPGAALEAHQKGKFYISASFFFHHRHPRFIRKEKERRKKGDLEEYWESIFAHPWSVTNMNVFQCYISLPISPKIKFWFKRGYKFRKASLFQCLPFGPSSICFVFTACYLRVFFFFFFKSVLINHSCNALCIFLWNALYLQGKWTITINIITILKRQRHMLLGVASVSARSLSIRAWGGGRQNKNIFYPNAIAIEINLDLYGA